MTIVGEHIACGTNGYQQIHIGTYIQALTKMVTKQKLKKDEHKNSS